MRCTQQCPPNWKKRHGPIKDNYKKYKVFGSNELSHVCMNTYGPICQECQLHSLCCCSRLWFLVCSYHQPRQNCLCVGSTSTQQLFSYTQARSQRGAKGGNAVPKLKLCPPPKCGRPTTNKTKCRPIVLTSTPYSYTRSGGLYQLSESLPNAIPLVTLTSCPFSLFSPPVKNPLKCPASLTQCGTGRLNDIWALCRLWV